MLKISLGIVCAFFSGALLAVPISMGVNAKWSPLFGVPVALILLTGLTTVAVLFFAPAN